MSPAVTVTAHPRKNDKDTGILAQEQRLQGVVEAEVHATVDEDADSGDGEASVQALDTVRLEGLHVHIDQTVELAFTTLTLGIVSQPGPSVVKGVDEEQGHCSGGATTGQVSSPEGVDSLSCQDPLGAVHHTVVWLVQTTLLDHLILVLDEQLDSLNGGGGSLGDTSGHAREHEGLKEPKFLVCHLYL